MECFLNDETIQDSRIRVRRVKRILYGLVVLTLALLVVLCLLTHTGNARTMLFITMLSMVLLGWGIIALWMFAAEPMKAEEQHLTGLAAAEPECREGLFFLDSDVFRIPKSVRVRKVRLETGEEPLSLNLNDRLTGKMPPDGSRVRVRTARKFITALEVLESGPACDPRRKSTGVNKVLRGSGRFFLPAVLWAMTAVLFTGFVFNQITDTSPENKIVLYADCELQNAPVLAEKLEKALDGAVRMVKIHPFSYSGEDLYFAKDDNLVINLNNGIVTTIAVSSIPMTDKVIVYKPLFGTDGKIDMKGIIQAQMLGSMGNGLGDNPMAAAMLLGDGEFDVKTMAMLSMANGGKFNEGGINGLLPLMLLDGKGDKEDLLPLLALQGMGGKDQNPLTSILLLKAFEKDSKKDKAN